MPPLFFPPIELGREQSSRTNHSSAFAVLNSIADIYQYAWQVYEHACLFPQEVLYTCMHECTMLYVSTREYSRADMPTFIIMVVKCSHRGNVNWKLNIIHICWSRCCLVTSMLIFSVQVYKSFFDPLLKKSKVLCLLLSKKLIKSIRSNFSITYLNFKHFIISHCIKYIRTLKI